MLDAGVLVQGYEGGLARTIVCGGDHLSEEHERAPLPATAAEDSRPAAGNEEQDHERERDHRERRRSEREELAAVHGRVDLMARDDEPF